MDSDGIVKPGEQKWTMRLVAEKSDSPSKGDVFLDDDGSLFVYDGENWQKVGGGGTSQEYVDLKVNAEAEARQNADNELEGKIPTKISQLSNDSGYLTSAEVEPDPSNPGRAKVATAAETAAYSDFAISAGSIDWTNVQNTPDLSALSSAALSEANRHSDANLADAKKFA